MSKLLWDKVILFYYCPIIVVTFSYKFPTQNITLIMGQDNIILLTGFLSYFVLILLYLYLPILISAVFYG